MMGRIIALDQSLGLPRLKIFLKDYKKMEKRKLLIAGNWKMNGSASFTRKLLEELVKKVKEEKNDVAVFPPFVYLFLAKEIFGHSSLKFGAQDVSLHEQGAYTGEISAGMLADIGC